MSEKLLEVDGVVREPGAIRPSDRGLERTLEMTILEHVKEYVRLGLGPQLTVLRKRPGEDAGPRPRRADDEHRVGAYVGQARGFGRDRVQVSGRRLGGLRFGLGDPSHPKRLERPAVELAQLAESALLQLALLGVAPLELPDPVHLRLEGGRQRGPRLKRLGDAAVALDGGIVMALVEEPDATPMLHASLRELIERDRAHHEALRGASVDDREPVLGKAEAELDVLYRGEVLVERSVLGQEGALA